MKEPVAILEQISQLRFLLAKYQLLRLAKALRMLFREIVDALKNANKFIKTTSFYRGRFFRRG